MKSKDGGPGDMTSDESKLYDQLYELLNDEKNKKDLKNDDGIDIDKIISDHIKKSIDEIDKLLKAYDEKFKKNKSSDKASDADDKDEKANEQKNDDDKSNDKSKQPGGDESSDEENEDMREYKKLSDKKARYEKIKKHDKSGVSEEIGKEFINLIVDAIAEATKNDANSEEVAKSQADAKDAARALATDNLQKYMNAFAGPEAAKSFNAKDIIMIYVTQDAKSPNDGKLVSNF